MRLPEKYREVILLSDLEGKTREQVAAVLGCPAGTVASRLARGRALLAKRLSAQVQSLPPGSLVAALASSSSTHLAVPPALVAITVDFAAQEVGGSTSVGLVSNRVSALADGVLKTMLVNQLIKLMLIAAAISLVATGTGLLLANTRSAGPGELEAIGVVDDQKKATVEPVDSVQVLADFGFNEALADEKYLKKEVQIVCDTLNVRVRKYSPFDSENWCRPSATEPPPSYMIIETFRDNAEMRLIYGFAQDEQKSLASLQWNSLVTIRGECLGRVTTNNGKEIVCIKNCKIVATKKKPE
jgi:hypothetical protein